MKHLTFRVLAMIIVQELAMIFFMRVVRWDIFISSGLSASIAIVFSLVFYSIQKRIAARKSDS
ncbi:MAG TPA: hypothetical protein VGO57_04785 [Verrucomicrobiae bacterium]|jgi:hypothetical protein